MTRSGALDRLRTEASRFLTGPYLLTVTAQRRPHCIMVAVTWRADRIVVSAPSEWAASESADLKEVSLLWPPVEPGGYSLIVDGIATTDVTGDGSSLWITPTRAVFHRTGATRAPGGSTCKSDCISILPV